jgi:transcriptional regulator with XRE-family HTH domain
MLVALFNVGAIAIGGELYRHRTALEWSQRDLAVASGLSEDTIERMERGLSNFGYETFVRAFTPFGLAAFGRALTTAATAYKRAIP